VPETVATDAFKDRHAAVAVTSCFVLSLNVAVAASWAVWPASVKLAVPEMLTDVTDADVGDVGGDDDPDPHADAATAGASAHSRIEASRCPGREGFATGELLAR
jgi:hypothetical protein